MSTVLQVVNPQSHIVQQLFRVTPYSPLKQLPCKGLYIFSGTEKKGVSDEQQRRAVHLAFTCLQQAGSTLVNPLILL